MVFFNRCGSSAAGRDYHGRAALWRNDLLFQSLLNSLIVAMVVTLACVLVGTAAAVVSARTRLRGRALLDGLVYLPLVIPEIIAVAL
jgi:spermidine/putrescine transport system permease protein